MGRGRPKGGFIAVGALVAAAVAACSGGAASAPGRTAAHSATPPSAVPYALGRYQPLWPFAGAGEAADWQRRYRENGQQPWRLSADQTALAFDRYLGFDEIDRVTRRTIGAGEARIGVGGHDAAAGGTAAVIHLIRLGAGPMAPWEVVGTDDDGLMVTSPAYGATVSSPIKISGRITGVDESVRVQLRQRSSAAPIGGSCCVSAGGDRARWSATVSFHGAVDPIETLVVSAGGHSSGVERFAVTAVRIAQ